jgi:hypothetical protein
MALCYIYPLIIINLLFSPPWLDVVKRFFAHHSLPSPHSSGAWLWGCFIRKRLSTSPCGRFKMDPGLRPGPVFSVAFACLGNTLQLNQNI